MATTSIHTPPTVTNVTRQTDHVAIEASAGSGKTFRLSQRYTSLALAGANPKGILAATFTRKAAGEILQRVIRSLINDANTSPAAVDALWRVASLGDQLAVGTLDSFFSTLAAGLALDVAVAPAWRIAEAEEDAELRVSSVETAVASMNTDHVMSLVHSLSHGKYSRSPLDTLLRAVSTVEGEYEATSAKAGGSEVWTLDMLPKRIAGECDSLREYDPSTIQEASDHVLRAWIDQLRRVALPKIKSGTVNANYSKAITAASGAISNRNWKQFIKAGLGGKVFEHTLGSESVPTYYKIELSIELINAFVPVVQHARSMLLAAFRARSEATGELLSTLSAAHREARLRSGLLRFSDIPELLLASNAMQRGDLALAIDTRVSHMLLDEFQDTSLVQFRLLLPLIEEIVSVADGSRTFFCVGDPKQSLYRWRGAEPELMRALTDRYPAIHREPLLANWRSSPVVLRAADAVLVDSPGTMYNDEIIESFGSFAGHTPQRPNRPGAAVLVEVGSAQSNLVVDEASDDVDHNAIASDSASTTDRADAINAYIARRVLMVRTKAPWASVGVLVRRNSRVVSLLTALRAVGVEASEEAGNPLAASSCVAAIASLMHLCEFPGDSACYFHIANSPLARIVETGDQLDLRRAAIVSRRWRTRISRVGISACVRSLARAMLNQVQPDFAGASKSSYEAQRLDAAHELAERYEASGGSSPGDFAKLLRSKSIADPSRSKVTVLTLHKAKGLEFDSVFLAELDSKWSKPRPLVVERVDEQGNHQPLAPVRRVFVMPDKLVQSLSPELQAACDYQLIRSRGEDICGLYVAMTRAIHHMEMVIEPQGSSSALNAASLLRARLCTNSTQITGVASLHQDAQLNPDILSTHTQSGHDPTAQTSIRVLYHDGLAANDEWISAALREREDAAQSVSSVSSASSPQDVTLRDVRIILDRSAPTPAWRRERASPSSLEGGSSLQLGRIFAPRDDTPRLRGTRFHYWASCIDWLDSLPVASFVPLFPDASQLAEQAFAAGLTRSPLECMDDARSFATFLASSTAKATLSRDRYLGREGTLRVRMEWSFATMVTDNATTRLINGQFDRIVMGVRDNGSIAWAEIIDWKTDDATSPQAIAQRVAIYAPQLRAYSLAARAMLGLDADQVSASLVLIAAGQIITV